jgi:hypothetical protein
MAWGLSPASGADPLMKVNSVEGGADIDGGACGGRVVGSPLPPQAQHRGNDCAAVGAVGHQGNAVASRRNNLQKALPTTVGATMPNTDLPRELIRPNRLAETVLRIWPVGIAICPASVQLRRLHKCDGPRLQNTSAGRNAVRAF